MTVSRSAGAVTGMVRFFDGGTLLDESAIASGVARLTIATLAAGTHGISAMYVGATNVPASQSPVVAVRVSSGGSRTPSLSWSVTLSTGSFGAESTFKLQIARSLGTSPTGWVQFSIDGLPPDPAHRVNVQTNGTSASTATLRLSTPSARHAQDHGALLRRRHIPPRRERGHARDPVAARHASQNGGGAPGVRPVAPPRGNALSISS